MRVLRGSVLTVTRLGLGACGLSAEHFVNARRRSLDHKRCDHVQREDQDAQAGKNGLPTDYVHQTIDLHAQNQRRNAEGEHLKTGNNAHAVGEPQVHRSQDGIEGNARAERGESAVEHEHRGDTQARKSANRKESDQDKRATDEDGDTRAAAALTLDHRRSQAANGLADHDNAEVKRQQLRVPTRAVGDRRGENGPRENKAHEEQRHQTNQQARDALDRHRLAIHAVKNDIVWIDGSGKRTRPRVGFHIGFRIGFHRDSALHVIPFNSPMAMLATAFFLSTETR